MKDKNLHVFEKAAHTTAERKVDRMEKTRRAIRLLLFLAVLAAVVCGVLYYFYGNGNPTAVTEGTLIAAFLRIPEGIGYGR